MNDFILFSESIAARRHCKKKILTKQSLDKIQQDYEFVKKIWIINTTKYKHYLKGQWIWIEVKTNTFSIIIR